MGTKKLYLQFFFMCHFCVCGQCHDQNSYWNEQTDRRSYNWFDTYDWTLPEDGQSGRKVWSRYLEVASSSSRRVRIFRWSTRTTTILTRIFTRIVIGHLDFKVFWSGKVISLQTLHNYCVRIREKLWTYKNWISPNFFLAQHDTMNSKRTICPICSSVPQA